MKKVPLTRGLFALVSDRDYRMVSRFKWLAQKTSHRGFYAARRDWHPDGTSTYIYMHRFILQAKRGLEVDHKNRNGLDNRRRNLRLCTHYQNQRNSPPRKHSSKFKGVSFNRRINRWDSFIVFKYKTIRLGQFRSEREAAIAYNKAAKRLSGKFAWINKI